MMITDEPVLIKAAERNYGRFLVPTSMVEAKKIARRYTWEDQADLDVKTSVNKIGEIVNLSQELNTKLWDAANAGAEYAQYEELYCEIAKLDVLSNIEIDKAKREYAVDSAAEIGRLRKKYEERSDDGRQIKPNFLGRIARLKGYYDGGKKEYRFRDTAMDYLQHSVNAHRVPAAPSPCIPFSDLLVRGEYAQKSVWYPQVEKVTEMARAMRAEIRAVWNGAEDGLENYEKAVLTHEIRAEYSERVRSMRMSPHTVYRLMLAIEEPRNKDIARTLFYALFSAPNQSFLELVEKSREPVATLTEVTEGPWDVELYGFRFKKETLGPQETETGGT